MRVFVQLGEETPQELVIDERSMNQVRASFNPSGSEKIDTAKVLCAALLTYATHAAAGENAGDEERRLAAIARTHIETGAMFIVKALTTQLAPALEPSPVDPAAAEQPPAEPPSDQAPPPVSRAAGNPAPAALDQHD